MASSIGSLLSPVINGKENSFGVSPKTAVVFAVGIGLGVAAACAASRFFNRNAVVLSSEQHEEMVEKIVTLDRELKSELLRKTLDSVDPNPDLLDQIESLQDKLTKKNEEASRLMAEQEEELSSLRQLLSSRKTAQVVPHSVIPAGAKDSQEKIFGLQSSLLEMQRKLESSQSLSDQNAREAFQAEEAVEKLSFAMGSLESENLGLKEEVSGLREEKQMLEGQIDRQEKELRKLEREVQTLSSALQSKQEEIDDFPLYLGAENRDMQEAWQEQEEAFLKEIYQGLGLGLPKKLDLDTAREDFKLFFHASQKSQTRDNQRWIAAIEALAVLQGRSEEAGR